MSLLLALALSSSYDLIIQGGMVYDGAGKSGHVADVAIRGDRIVKVGKLGKEKAKRRIDARGLVVSPGFIGMLGQSEITLLVDGRAQSKVYQGITSKVTGEGWSVAPDTAYIDKESADYYRHIGLKPGWTDLDDYFRRLKQARPATNIGTFVGATQVRMCVMRQAQRDPTPAELAKIRTLVCQAYSGNHALLGRP